VALRTALRWTLRALATIVAAAVVVPPAQVLLARFVDPPLTLTMLDRAWAHRAETGEWAWVDYRPLDLDALGPNVARAAVSSEDARFWLHHGFDWEAICKAIDAYDEDARRLRGGSTISQQVAKNVFLWQTRSFVRKGLEVYYTGLLELLVPKARILALYLNVAETGRMTFGFEAGAWRYYGRAAHDLSHAQAAGLAAVLPSPQKWSPTRNPAASRAAWVLANPAPFPGDRGWDALVEKWAEEGPSPWDCWR
jgi:monofunctional biosynthetic peptidoglycan transglycosylase